MRSDADGPFIYDQIEIEDPSLFVGKSVNWIILADDVWC